MSNTQKPTAAQTGPEVVEGVVLPPVEEKRPNILIRGARKIKQTPPKTALAVLGGVGLVAAGAWMGRSSAPYHVEIVDSETPLEPILVTPSSDGDDNVA